MLTFAIIIALAGFSRIGIYHQYAHPLLGVNGLFLLRMAIRSVV
jgi:hypothetical protein